MQANPVPVTTDSIVEVSVSNKQISFLVDSKVIISVPNELLNFTFGYLEFNQKSLNVAIEYIGYSEKLDYSQKDQNKYWM